MFFLPLPFELYPVASIVFHVGLAEISVYKLFRSQCKTVEDKFAACIP